MRESLEILAGAFAHPRQFAVHGQNTGTGFRDEVGRYSMLETMEGRVCRGVNE